MYFLPDRDERYKGQKFQTISFPIRHWDLQSWEYFGGQCFRIAGSLVQKQALEVEKSSVDFGLGQHNFTLSFIEESERRNSKINHRLCHNSTIRWKHFYWKDFG